tara:strand:+ start:1333 stop:3291 length:1959 start_codon:yes stop_codon:yes gene_type:complete
MTEKQKNDLMTRKLFQGVRDSQRLTQGMTEKQIQDLRAGRMPTNPTAQYGPQQSAFTPPSTPPPAVGPQSNPTDVSVTDIMGQNVINPLLPQQAVFQPVQQQVQPGELLPSTSGQAALPSSDLTAQQANIERIQQQTPVGAATYVPTQVALPIDAEAAQGRMGTNVIQGQTGTASAGQAVTGQIAGTIDPITGRTVDRTTELGQAVSYDPSFLGRGEYTAPQSDFTGSMQAATMEVTEDMTVQGQLKNIGQQFEDGNVPDWAAGIVRGANAEMFRRGIARSSMAGAAITQAFLEASVPIATADAQTYYNTAVAVMNNEQAANLENSRTNLAIETMNLNNRQSVGLAKMQVEAALAGQELSNQQQINILNANKFSEAANMTFSQEQNRVFANSKMIETLNLQNLSNEQAMALANAATLANMDIANLSNNQQAAVQNAQNFLSMDLANLTNEQQMRVLNQNAMQQVMLTNMAAMNAAAQFNAQSQNQLNQFFSELQNNINTSNANAFNASEQFNAGQTNAFSQFKESLRQDTEKFNANNSLIVDQSNVKWRRNVNTANTSIQNAANQINAQNYYNMSNAALSNIWQEYRDEAAFVYQSSQNDMDRAFNYAMATLEAETTMEQLNVQIAQRNAEKLGGFITAILTAITKPKEVTS